MTEDYLEKLRALCMKYPEATEQNEGSVGNPVFKVRDKIFAMRHAMDGRPSLWCKAPSGAQTTLVSSEPEHYFVPPYVGQHGWVGVWLDGSIDWEMLADLIEASYRKTAPKRLLALLPGH